MNPPYLYERKERRREVKIENEGAVVRGGHRDKDKKGQRDGEGGSLIKQQLERLVKTKRLRKGHDEKRERTRWGWRVATSNQQQIIPEPTKTKKNIRLSSYPSVNSTTVSIYKVSDQTGCTKMLEFI